MVIAEKCEQYENKSNEQILSPESFVFIQGMNPNKISREELNELKNQELNGGRKYSNDYNQVPYKRPSIIQRLFNCKM